MNENNKIKREELIDIYVRPLSNLNLKLWIQDKNDSHRNPSIGIGLGSKKGIRVFSFVILNEKSLNWLVNSIRESQEIKNNNYPDFSQKIWEEIIDNTRKISILIQLKKDEKKISTNLMLNSKNAFLYDELSEADINWILTTLEIAKFKLLEANNGGNC